MRLVDEWRIAWRWFSLQAMALVAVIQGAWAAMPDDLKAHFPARLVTVLSVGLLLLGIGGRLVKQRRG
jgi:anti-sigma-K factor RskA